jgi:sialate O-acetylesterase
MWVAGVAGLLGVLGTARAEVKLNPLFGAGMVVQRDVPVRVWGTAAAGEAVKVEMGGKQATTTASAEGRWETELAALPAGGPLEIVVTGSGNVVRVGDVLVGDVWLISGQSNMAMNMTPLKGTAYEGDLASANFPKLRHGLVARNPQIDPVEEVSVAWRNAGTPAGAEGFSAAGFYFARELHRELGGVPIGLLHPSWGGTSAEAWVSMAALSGDADFKVRAEEQLANLRSIPERAKAVPGLVDAWEKATGRTDPGNPPAWGADELDEAGWTKSALRTRWRDMGLADGGVAWVRHTIELPAGKPNRDLRIDFGQIDEQYAWVWFNGEKVGEFGREPPEFYFRYYGVTIPAEKLRPGKNTLAVRFLTHTGDRMPINRRANQLGGVVNVSDEVRVKVEKAFAALTREQLAQRPAVPKGSPQGTSSTLYNGMVHPLRRMPVKGVLWYQGEQDAGRAYAYRRLLPLLIGDWRGRLTGGAELPFIVQQLPNWIADGAENTGWAELREAQCLTSRSVPRTYLSVGIDLGEANDVHPRNKRDIGKRLALVALEKVYGRAVVSSGPVYESMQVAGGKARLKFRNSGGLKPADGQALKRFTIAGEDRKFVPAEAVIEGDVVVVSATAVPNPVSVRYAFINNPEGANLTDGSGLPAMPFRTDDWPGATANRK